METPKKTKSYSPVILAQSPAAESPQRNLTGLPRVARDISADIYNNIQLWNTMHINGASIMQQVVLLKCDSSTDGLESLITDLYKVIESLELVSSGLSTSAQQLNSLIKLHKSAEPLFISWPTQKMYEVAQKIATDYNREYKLKRFIMEYISHIDGKDRLMFYAACWIHQPYITSETVLQLESLLTETGHRTVYK